MVEVNLSDHCNDRPDRQPVEKPALNSLEGTPEGQQVRNATGGHVEAIKAANPNASDGSVKNWAQMTGAERYFHAEQNGQEESFVLVDQKPSGIEVVAARQMVPGVKLESQEQPIGQNLIVQNLAEVDDRPIKNYDYHVTQHGPSKVIETGLQYQVGKPPEVTERSLFERIGALPLEQQAFVVGAAIKAYNGELTHQQFRIGVGLITGLGDGVVGLAEGAESLGTAIIGVAQFSRDVLANDPAAVDTAGKAGESLGKLMVGGIHVFSAADAYLGSIGAATNDGDYTKALRDVSWLGRQINSRWEVMSPEEKTRLTTKLAVENLGDLALIVFRTAKIAKSEKIIKTLEAMGTEASEMGAGQRDKAGKFISRLLDELMPQPMGVTPDGRLMPIQRDYLRNEAKALMSKADDLEGKPLSGRRGASEPVHEKEIVNPIDRTASVEQKVSQLEALSRENKLLVEAFLRQVDAKLGTKSEISFKTAKDIADKAKRPSIKDAKDWFDVEHVRDAFRFKTPIENLKDLPLIVRALKEAGFEMVKADLDRLLTPKGRGWRMAALDLRAPNGQIIEYQILPIEINEAGKFEHAVYKSVRGMDVIKLTSIEALAKIDADKKAIELYRGAFAHYLSRTGQTEDTIRGFIGKTKKVLEER